MLQVAATLEGHNDRVWCVAWDKSGEILATSSSDKTVRIWKRTELEGKKWLCKSVLSDAHSRTIRSISFSPCGRYLASTSFDSTVIVWEKNRESGEFEVLSTLEGHENEAKCAVFSPSGRYLASCSRDKSVWVWEMDEEDDFQCCSILQVHSQDVKQVIWHPSDDLLVSCSYDNSIKFYRYDGDDWTTVTHLNDAHESTIWSVAFDSQGDRLASCSDDRTIKIWKKRLINSLALSGKERWDNICTIDSTIHPLPIYSIDWCPNTNYIATGCGDNGIRIFRQIDQSANDSPDAAGFELVETVKNAHNEDINCVRWNPTVPGLLASASDDGYVKLWNLNNWH